MRKLLCSLWFVCGVLLELPRVFWATWSAWRAGALDDDVGRGPERDGRSSE